MLIYDIEQNNCLYDCEWMSKGVPGYFIYTNENC